MGKYLVVAHQTASSPELLEKLTEIAREDAAAEFMLLVPATPVGNLLAWVEGEARLVAERTAEEAKETLERSGLKITRVAVGDPAPVTAVQDDLRDNPTHYEAIVVSTLPLGVSRWLRLDVPHQIERRFDIPVIRVETATKTGAEA